ncbi:MAG TPA: DUF397 domain-containing protein [Streptosporangiaceae bacterium]|nr:DUF397 domain-containing protein [Streptosporangiaceae bacterium]
MSSSHSSRAATQPAGDIWVKSRHSGPTGGNCVEVAFLAGGGVAVRNSRHPDGPALIFTAAEWDAFISAACHGDVIPAAHRPSSA